MAEPATNRLAGLLRPGYKDVTRSCRYGHGLLGKSARSWSLINHVRSGETDPQGYHSGQLQFRCAVWVCPTCGYMELSDTVD